jgi:hypothetical protein
MRGTDFRPRRLLAQSKDYNTTKAATNVEILLSNAGIASATSLQGTKSEFYEVVMATMNVEFGTGSFPYMSPSRRIRHGLIRSPSLRPKPPGFLLF